MFILVYTNMGGKTLQSISLIIKINQMKKITIWLVVLFIVHTNYKGMVNQFKGKQEVPERKNSRGESNQ